MIAVWIVSGLSAYPSHLLEQCSLGSSPLAIPLTNMELHHELGAGPMESGDTGAPHGTRTPSKDS